MIGSLIRFVLNPVKPVHVARFDDNILYILAPVNAHITRIWLESKKGVGWQVTALILGLAYAIFGGFLLVGGWYASIQGIRAPLAVVGLVNPAELWNFPSVFWWFVPIFISIAEVLPKALPGTRILWWPTYIYDSATNGIFFAIGIIVFLVSFDHEYSLFWCGFVGAIFGLLTAVWAERLFLSGLLILRVAFIWDR